MGKQVISINGYNYVVTGKVVESFVQPLSDAFRTTGLQRRSDNPKLNRHFFQGFPLGIGWNRADRDTGRGVGGARDATADTRFRIVEPPILHESQTHATPADHPKKLLNFLGNLWGIFEEDYSAAALTGIFARVFGGTSDGWTGGGTISEQDANSEGKRAFDAIVHKGALIVVGNGGASASEEAETAVELWRSTDGVTWSIISGTGWAGAEAPSVLTSAIVQRNNFDDDMARLLDFGNTLMVARAAGDGASTTVDRVRVYYSTDNGTNWTAGAVVSGQSSGPKAFVRWKNPFASPAADSPVLITPNGIYRVDSAGTTFDLIYPLDGDSRNGRWAVVGRDGGLYVGLGSGKVIVLYIADTGTLEVRESGPPEGLVSARQGVANFFAQENGTAPTEPFLYVAYGGAAASRQGSIFAIDYNWRQDPVTDKYFQPWHSMYQEADANIDLYLVATSPADDRTPRLHFALENASSAEMFHLERYDVSGAPTGITIKRQDGYVEVAEDDGGDPQTDGATFESRIDADNLDNGTATTGSHIQHQYGVDGAAWTNVTLGNYFNDDKDQLWASGQGVQFKTIRHQLNLNVKDSDNTKGPQLKEFEFRARKKLLDLSAWEHVIDLEESAKEQREDTEAVIARLKTAARSAIGVPYRIGQEPEVQVEVRLPPVFELELVGGDDERSYGRRTGTVSIRLEEIT